MDNFIKRTDGYVEQYFEKNKDGVFVCTAQEFFASDLCEYVDDGKEPIEPQVHQYQPYNMEV